MFSATVTTVVSGADSSYGTSFNVSGGKKESLNEDIPTPSTDLAVNFALVISKAKMLCLLSDQALTIKTNDSGSPDNTFTLEANVPFIWPKVEGQDFKDTEDADVTEDITALYVTNASGVAATLRADAILDPT